MGRHYPKITAKTMDLHPAVAFGTAGYAAGTGLGVSLYGALRGP